MKKILGLVFFIAAAFLLESGASADIYEGLLAYLPLDGNANDYSGNNNDGEALYGVGWVPGRFGQSASFDGTDDFIDLGEHVTPDHCTISVWVKTLDGTNNYGIVSWHVNTPENTGGIDVHIGITNSGDPPNYAGASFLDEKHTSGMHPRLFGTSNVADGNWHHVVFVYDGDASLYVDGCKEKTLLRNSTIINQVKNLHIGHLARHDIGEYHFTGQIDEVRIYDRAISEGEIKELFNYSDFVDTTKKSEFVSDHEGWEISGAGNRTWAPFFGNPEGHLIVEDLESGLLKLVAPNDFIGDLSDYEDGTLSFDVKLYRKENDELYERFGEITITGNGYTAVADLVSGDPPDAWRTFGIDFSAAAWGVSKSTWTSILRNVSSISIIVDSYQYYNDTIGFDNFTISPIMSMGHSTPEPEPSTPPKTETKQSEYGPGPNACSGGSPFFVESGDFFLSHTDVAIPARGLPLRITRYYNSQDLYDGPFGLGWNMDYATRLVETESDGNEYATVRMGSGLRIEFAANGDGSYSPPLGSHGILVKNGDGSFTLNGRCGTCAIKATPVYQFNPDGSLSFIEDLNGNRVSVEYDDFGRISAVVDANDRSLSFAYGGNGKVETIQDFSTPSRSWGYTYDTDKNLTSVTDPMGNTLQYDYDENHNLTKIIDPRGNEISSIAYGEQGQVEGYTQFGGAYNIEYDPVEQTTRKMDPAENSFSFEYDQYGNITNKLNPASHTLDLTWDADINVTGRTNSRGVKTNYTYDDRGNVLSVVRDAVDGGLQITAGYQYDSRFDKVTKVTDPRNNITDLVYDENGNLIQHQAPGGTSYYEYDEYGNITRVTDADGYITAMEYDMNGYLTRVYIPDTQPVVETVFVPDQRGNILSRTDPNGNTIHYEYDPLDRLKKVRDPFENDTSFEYDQNGNVICIVDPKENETRFEYDDFNRLSRRIDAYGIAGLERGTSYSYDTRGNLVSATDPLDHVTHYTYDELNRMFLASNHMNHEWRFAYDENGNLNQKTDPNGNITQYSYNALNRLASVTDAEGRVTEYTYDENGNLLTVVDANGHTAVTNSYDAENRLETTKDALDKTSSATYTSAGRIHTRTDANVATTYYVYEALTGRLSKIQYAGGREETFAYDLAGNMLSISDNQTGATVSFTYDELNRVASDTQLGQTISYAYDENGNRISMTVSCLGDFEYAYDALNRLTTITNHLDQTTGYNYNANDFRTQVTYANGARTEYEYDDANRLEAIIHKRSDNTVIESFTYTYDYFNNRLSVQDHADSLITYDYDKTYQLVEAVYPDETFSYTYDNVGNRLTKTDLTGQTAYEYDLANRLTSYIQPNSSQVDFTYDDNGNTHTKVENGQTTTYTYDSKDQLRRIDYPDGTNNQFTYDPSGRRIRVVDSLGIRRFLHDGQNPLADISGDDAIPNISTAYTPSLGIDDLISMHQAGDTYYYLRDDILNVRIVLDCDLVVKASYNYSPFGHIRIQNGQNGNYFTFTGRRKEVDSRMLFYRSRYYNERLGRFNKKDGFSGTIFNPLSINRYTYVQNNPVKWMDPMGRTLMDYYGDILDETEKRMTGQEPDTNTAQTFVAIGSVADALIAPDRNETIDYNKILKAPPEERSQIATEMIEKKKIEVYDATIDGLVDILIAKLAGLLHVPGHSKWNIASHITMKYIENAIEKSTNEEGECVFRLKKSIPIFPNTPIESCENE